MTASKTKGISCIIPILPDTFGISVIINQGLEVNVCLTLQCIHLVKTASVLNELQL